MRNYKILLSQKKNERKNHFRPFQSILIVHQQDITLFFINYVIQNYENLPDKIICLSEINDLELLFGEGDFISKHMKRVFHDEKEKTELSSIFNRKELSLKEKKYYSLLENTAFSVEKNILLQHPIEYYRFLFHSGLNIHPLLYTFLYDVHFTWKIEKIQQIEIPSSWNHSLFELISEYSKKTPDKIELIFKLCNKPLDKISEKIPFFMITQTEYFLSFPIQREYRNDQSFSIDFDVKILGTFTISWGDIEFVFHKDGIRENRGNEMWEIHRVDGWNHYHILFSKNEIEINQIRKSISYYSQSPLMIKNNDSPWMILNYETIYHKNLKGVFINHTYIDLLKFYEKHYPEKRVERKDIFEII